MHRSRTGEFEEFSQLLGSNTSKGFVSDAILNLISERYNSLMKEKVTPNSYESENVSRICIIEYNSSVDPLVVAGKLKSYPDVEYAEPLYTRKIVGVPNDPLLNKQYCLTQIKVYDAWDSLKTSDTLTIGIVDTGVDYNHEDLSANMFINPGETGLDSAGHDKRFNGIDDDHNGLVDDWRGWDFESSTSPTGQDNDPQPGHEHGTHVAGIIGAVINNHIGIAGVAENVKLLAVKVSQDDPSSGSIYNGYEGVLYAASMGASVINCSWGSPNKSQAEEDMIKQAINMGSVLVAAAGNDAANLPYYPAADENVLSVAAVDSYDIKAGFSNYHNSISVSAPGVEIYSTLPGNQYDALSGTSMSSPIAAGVAALVRLKFPQYTPLQVVEQVKASSDNIDSLNPFYIGTIGKGRVNAFKAVTSSNLKSVILNSYQFTNPDYNDIIDIGDTVEITISLTNVLSPMINGKILTGTISNSPYSLNFINDTSTIGTMNTLETKSALSNIIFSVPGNIPPNYITTIEIKIFDDTTYCNSVYFDLNIHPSYRTMNGNDITVTFNNRGDIGYNDYPKNNQGIGFIYKNYPNILYEGALMVGTSATKLSDVARGPFQNFEDDAFNSNETFVIDTNGKTAKYEGT
ncbi:MAG: S8 family peptidase, partial [FCB group bacterium]